MLLGECYDNLGHFDQALTAFNKAVALNPDAPEGHIAIGETLDKQGKSEEAVNEFRQAVKLNPGNALAWQKLGNLHFALADFASAISAYERACRLNSNLEKLQLCYALAFYGFGDYEQAQHYYDLAKRNDAQASVLFLQIFPEAADHITL